MVEVEIMPPNHAVVEIPAGVLPPAPPRRALQHEAPAGVDLDVVRVAYAEAALIRQEFRAIIGGGE